MYLVDISIFVGSQSEITTERNCTTSYGPDGFDALVENAGNTDCNAHAATSPTCIQMSMPLTYDDGINQPSKRCDQDEAYYACDVPCK